MIWSPISASNLLKISPSRWACLRSTLKFLSVCQTRQRASSWTASHQTQMTGPLRQSCCWTPSSGRPPGRRSRLHRNQNLTTLSLLVEFLHVKFVCVHQHDCLSLPCIPIKTCCFSTCYHFNHSLAVFCSWLSTQLLRTYLHLGGGHRLVLGFNRPFLFAGLQAQAHVDSQSGWNLRESAQQQLAIVSIA